MISYIWHCTMCAEFSNAQQKQPLQTSTVPSRPWSWIAIDLFMFNKKHYMITVDYYCDYFEIDQLNYITSTTVKNLKSHFKRHGIPDEVMTDTGPNLISNKFAKFAGS